MAYLADVNFLIALLHERHAASLRAAAWLDSEDEPRNILLCRVAQMGALRILTNPAWLKEDVLPARAVWDAWDLLLTDERFARVNEPSGLEPEWRRVTEELAAGQCAETDTYFAAFARAGGHRLLTFDRGFRRFEGLDVVILE
jgi:toxin-antitoxin system PIN domain toxin